MEYNITIRGQIGGWFGVSPVVITDYLSKHKGEKVDVAICSPGGFVDDGLEIYQAFKDHGDVHAHIIGMTASAATVIAMGAKSVDMAKNSLLLIHNASAHIDEWGSVNKEKIDQLLAKFKKQRDDLSTIDDLIASIYADRCAKSMDDIRKKMTEGRWLSSQEALDFGLIDAIREDEKADKVLNDIRGQYSNSYITDFGLPALPCAPATEDAAKAPSFVDSEGNPTESFLQKTLQALKTLVSNNSANKSKSKNIMKKVFASVCALMAVEALESKDGIVSLKEEDMQKVEDRLVKLEKDLEDAAKAKDGLQKQLDETKTTLSEREKEITALKGAPGDTPDKTPEGEETAADYEGSRKLFNLINPD